MRDTPPLLPLPERYGSVEWVRETADKRYDVAVRFSDGAQELFLFDGESPVSMGDQVAMTPVGLRRVGPAVAPLEGPGLSIPLP